MLTISFVLTHSIQFYIILFCRSALLLAFMKSKVIGGGKIERNPDREANGPGDNATIINGPNSNINIVNYIYQ